jgi:RNA polymerase sigma-70 factor (ECF subfamily)
LQKRRITIPEDQLVTLLQQKEQKAYSILYDNYSAALYGIVLKVVKNDDLAEDTLQDCFVKIWRNIDNYHASKGSLFTWMLNIARNTAIDKIRSKEYQNSQQSQNIENAVGIVDASHHIEASVDYISLRKVVDTLRPEYKQLIDLAYFQGYTQTEIAEEFGIPLGTVKTRIKAALTQLKGLLGISIGLLVYLLEHYATSN